MPCNSFLILGFPLYIHRTNSSASKVAQEGPTPTAPSCYLFFPLLYCPLRSPLKEGHAYHLFPVRSVGLGSLCGLPCVQVCRLITGYSSVPRDSPYRHGALLHWRCFTGLPGSLPSSRIIVGNRGIAFDIAGSLSSSVSLTLRNCAIRERGFLCAG